MATDSSIGPSAGELITPGASIRQLRAAIERCRGCVIWEHATQAVFGEGKESSEVLCQEDVESVMLYER